MTNKPFQHIALIGRPDKNIVDALEAVKDYLLQNQRSVYVEKNTADMMPSHPSPHFSDKKIPEEIDLVIVVGGDGSLLYAAHIALSNALPILGINRGHLGFLTDISPDELAVMGPVLAGHYQREPRTLLTAAIIRQEKQTHLGAALNDVVLLPGDLAKMIEFDIMINDQLVCQQRADGLIVATPTGSTAYALSGGGPILHPQLNATVLVSMFPHTLSTRPIVVDGDARIELQISRRNEVSPNVSCDGQHRVAVKPGDTIRIAKHPQLLQLIHPEKYDYFTTLREKLGWQYHTRKS